MHAILKAWGVCGLLAVGYAPAWAQDGFAIKNLPHGTDVTLPGPAITLVPVAERVQLSSTDTPQTIKLSSVNVRSGRKALPIKVAIHEAKKVKFLILEPGNSYMYSFSDVGSIAVVSEQPKVAGDLSQFQLRIESDKPLNIAR